MSDCVVEMVVVAVLLPPVPVPPLVSLVAPVVAVTVNEPPVVGVPETGHEIVAPAATVAGGTGVQAPTVTPGGRPETAHVALSADAVAVALLVHTTVPVYGVPTAALEGNPETSGVMSAPLMVTVRVAVLLAATPSLVAPVVPFTVEAPVAVGVPETEHVIVAPAASEATGTAGTQPVTVTPAGSPLTAHVALAAASDGEAAAVQVNVPEYATPRLPVVGRPERLMLISDCATLIVVLAVLFAVLTSFVELVVPLTVAVPPVVGVPETEQVMVAPAASEATGTAGEQPVTVTPAGSPVAAQVTPVAAMNGAAALVHVNVPE